MNITEFQNALKDVSGKHELVLTHFEFDSEIKFSVTEKKNVYPTEIIVRFRDRQTISDNTKALRHQIEVNEGLKIPMPSEDDIVG